MLFSIDSGTLENVKEQTWPRQKYNAYGHELWLDRPTLDVMPRSKDIERLSVIESSGRKDSARLGARHTNTCFQDGDRMA